MHDFYGVALGNRLMLGTALYPSPAILAEAVRVAGVAVVTVSPRRESAERRDGQAFWALIRYLGLRVLPNTPGPPHVKAPLTTPQLAPHDRKQLVAGKRVSTPV